MGDLFIVNGSGQYVLLQEEACAAFIEAFRHLYDEEGNVFAFQKIDADFLAACERFDANCIEDDFDRQMFRRMFQEGDHLYLGHNISTMACVSCAAHMPPILRIMTEEGCDYAEANRRAFRRSNKQHKKKEAAARGNENSNIVD